MRLTRPTSSLPRYGYTGREPDATGLIYYRARYYDPAIGRFTQRDPAGFADGLNLYAYVGNNPVSFTDPLGLSKVSPNLVSPSAFAGASERISAIGAEFKSLARDVLQLPQVQLTVGAGAVAAAGYAVATQPIVAAATAVTARVMDLQNAADGMPPAMGLSAVGSVPKYSPINPGPLADDVANTFRSSTYTERTLSSDTTLYRVISDNGNSTGSYWTSVKPQGPLQSVIDSALDQNWGNTATRVVTSKVPEGTTIYEGAAAAQRGLVGGGNQIYIPKVNPNWIQ
ncbi:RHS repeat-associated core domain-containing protein [Methylocaldum gracile subsp. desertum]|uniref:RHS repeat-associated core domain-containing protein n=1 Tax=Methylocaldum sp. GT1BW TaxID=3438964 RepID=UPI003DA186D2